MEKSPISSPPSPSEIVISGIAGRFPESNNMHELRDNLMEKRDMITEDERRWKMDHPRIVKRTGKISNLEKFDAAFFGVHPKQAHSMDPMCRMLLEHAYEAIVDAGVNPKQLRGTKTGVFVGTCLSESEKTLIYKEQESGLGITGCSRALYSNRISYWLGVVGPSFMLDAACSSSLVAFEQAYRSINDGNCDAAIVGGCNLCLDPYVSLQFNTLGALSLDGHCRTWDQSANGYVRSESVCVAFLQKAKDAKRIYATVMHSKINCDGYTEEGLTFPSRHMQSVLFRDLYKECGVSPSNVDYIEAHGTATKVGDPEEIAAIDEVLGQSRSNNSPLLIGTVKSNLGHTEPASGLVSIAKVILAMETGVIFPNLHFKKCHKDLKAILEGRLKVVTEFTPWKGKYAAVNNFGFGGANAHALLRINSKEKINNGVPDDDLPRLVVISGRTEDAVDHILEDLENKPADVEQLALLYNVHSDEIKGHLHRGYTIIPPHGIAKTPVREITSLSGVKRPVWFVFSGMGSQWPGMGQALLRIPIFAEAIEKCDIVLKPYDIDIFRVITDDSPSAFDNILNCFIGVTAMQIGLVNVLKSLGIEPDNIIGHSLGELGCAYADGCFTVEQTIMSAYIRGLVSVQSKFISGSMAAVGLGYREIKNLCPADIEVACHNSLTSSTISGPAESMRKFVAELQVQNIFAKEVHCGNIAYHSRYVTAVGPKLLEMSKKIIPNPKLRSSKWVSTSVRMDKWNTKLARYSSAEYHTNNFLSPVLFEETSALIPNDAITIEIAPHGLFQAILKRSLSTSVTNISLMQRDSKDNVDVLLRAIGKMFTVGLHPQIDKLYPPVAFPVSRGTPMISPLIKWEHKDDWLVCYFKDDQKLGSGERVVKINITNPDYKTIADHVLDGRNILPATSYLTLIWETFKTMKGKEDALLPVVFENVKFLRATTFPKDGEVDLTLMIQKGSGNFEVTERGAVVVSGSVRSMLTSEVGEEKWISNVEKSNEEEYMTSRDVYKEFKLRGYQYTGKFRSILRATENGSKAHIAWHDDWIAFMDNMLQITMLGVDTRELCVPVTIKKIVINPERHYASMDCNKPEKELAVFYDKLHNVVSSEGVQIFGLQARTIARRKFPYKPVLEEYKFIPFIDEVEMSLHDIARLVTNIVTENHVGVKIKTVEFLDIIDKSLAVDNLLSPLILESLADIPLIQANVAILHAGAIVKVDTLPADISIMDVKKASKDATAVLVVGHRLFASDRSDNLNTLLHELKPEGFVLTRENNVTNIEDIAGVRGFHVVLKKKVGNEIFALLRKKNKQINDISIINVQNDKFDWVETMLKTMSERLEKEKRKNSRIVFVGQTGFDNGLVGLINCLRKEPGGEIVRGILVQDPTAPAFSLDNDLYSQQLEKDLAISVLRENSVWGSYKHSLLPPFEPRHVYHSVLKQNIRGDLSSFTWIEGPLQPTHSSKNLIKIVYSSINFSDILTTTGKLPLSSYLVGRKVKQETTLGSEYSGVYSSGIRVMGLSADDPALANMCIAKSVFNWEIPDYWSLEDAATVPYVYLTCCYALYMKGNMKKGDKVLIHAGTSGIGQAAINLALAEGCEIFTTVDTQEKRQFIRKTFPQIRDDHIGYSRDTSFERMIKEQTNGYGVDLVLNSLSEEKLLASVNCVACGGCFLEIGKFDLIANTNNPLGMECFLRGVSFHGITFDHIFTACEQKQLEIKVLVDRYIKNGAIKPLVRTVFSKDNIEAAFCHMAAGKNIGKVIIHIQNENALTSMIPAVPQYYCLENRSYIILGGLGGFGLELCDWLVMRGAKNLVLTSRAGLKNGYQRKRVNLWKSYGVKVIIVAKKDTSVYEDCKFIIETAEKLAPVDGVFNLAVILKDAPWQNQTPENFEETFKSKAWTTKNLDSLTKIMCPKLRHFVVFSSVACGRGNASQSNYGMSHSVMERICENRAAEGLPALAVQWGAIGDVGLVADMQEDNKELIIAGTLQQSIFSCLKELNNFMLQSSPIVSSVVVAENKADGPASVLNSVLNILGLKDLKEIYLHSTLSELGMDSIMSIEIKQTLEREFDVFLSTHDIRNLTFAKLQDMTDDKSLELTPQKEAEVKTQSNKFSEMKMLVHFLHNASISHDAYLKLPTKAETKTMEVFAIPGIEGFASNFSGLSPKLKASVTCLQLGVTNNIHESIDDMANHFFMHVFNNCGEYRKFTLMGYSFGSLIAIELARRLEAQGLRGRIFLIDGAPRMVKDMYTREISWNNSEDLQNKCLLLMLHIVDPRQILKLNEDLEKCKNWDEKVEAFIKCCTTSKLGMNYENLRDYCTSIYKRMLAGINYDTSQLKPIEAPITLLKPTMKSIQTELEDYDLSKITKNQVEVHYVTGDHVTILENDKTADIINECISK